MQPAALGFADAATLFLAKLGRAVKRRSRASSLRQWACLCLILSCSLPRQRVAAQQGVVLVQVVQRLLLCVCKVLNSLINDLLLLRLLLTTDLVLQVEDASLCSKLLATQSAEGICRLIGKAVASLSATDTLEANLSPLHTLGSTSQTTVSPLQRKLSRSQCAVYTGQANPCALHSRLSALHTLSRTSQLRLHALKPQTRALDARTKELVGRRQTLEASLLPLHGRADTRQAQLTALQCGTKTLLRTLQTLETEVGAELHGLNSLVIGRLRTLRLNSGKL